ncbi:MAG: PAS domain-containing protein [Thermoleophilia bacterium]|nr:PAS domain-containing protein [Thermoleophilia bacterium]
MNLLPVLMGVSAGVCLEAALMHGLAGLSRRPRDGARLAFAIAALAVAAGSLALLFMYAAETPERYAAAAKWVFLPAQLTFTVAALWLVAYLSGLRSRRWLVPLTLGYAVALVVNLVLPFGLMIGQLAPLATVSVLGAEFALLPRSFPHELHLLVDALNLAAFVFVCRAVYQVIRRGEGTKGLILVIAGTLVSLTMVMDTLMDYGVLESFYLTQLSFVAVVFAVSIALRRESLRTEAALAAYRGQLEKELAESETRFRSLFGSMLEAVALHELVYADGEPVDYRILEVNPAFEHQVGLTREQVQGVLASEAYGADGAPYLAEYAAVVETGEPLSFDTYFAPLDRHFRVAAVSPAAGRFATIAEDITERKRVEAALRESEERLRMALRDTHVSVAIQDRDLRYVWAYNTTLARPDDLVGRADGDILTPEDAETVGAIKRRVLEQGVEVREQLWLQFPEGPRFLDLTFEPVRDEDGQVTGVGTSGIDLTPMKHIEESLRQSREDLDRAQAVGQVGSWRLDVRRNVLTWSDENHRIFGVPKGAPLAYETFLAAVHPDDRERVDRQWNAGLRGEPYDVEHRLLVDGAVKWVREKAFLEHDDAGELVGGFGITQDITERKRVEAMLEDRVQELDEANLRLAAEIAEREKAETALRRRVAQLDALRRLSQLLANRRDLSMAVDAATAAITELFGGCCSHVFLLDGGRMASSELWTDYPEEPGGGTAVVPLEDFPLFRETVAEGRVRAGGEPLLERLPPALRESACAAGVHHLIAPLTARARPVGVLMISRGADAGPFGERDTALAQIAADTVAAVVESERLHRQEKREAAVEERQRLARDLHDAVTQSLYSATLICEALPSLWAKSPDEGLHNLVRLRRLVRAALAEMRTLLLELRPEALESSPLSALLDRLGDALAGQIQIPVEVAARDPGSMPVEVKTAFYRAAQELLNNVARHAHADSVAIELCTEPEGVVLSVRDDGRGFDGNSGDAEHMGLRMMRERLQAVGARLELETAVGRGTTARVVWPGTAMVKTGSGGEHGSERV